MAQQPPLLCGQRGINPPYTVCGRRATHHRHGPRAMGVLFVCEWCAQNGDVELVAALDVLVVEVGDIVTFAGISQEPPVASRNAIERFRQAVVSAGAVVGSPYTTTHVVRYYPARAPLVTPYGD